MARPPFPTINDFVQIYPGGFNAGIDPVNLRDTYYPVSDFTLSDKFTMPGSSTQINGAWSTDSGDLGLPDSQKESRSFCLKGKASIQVNGTAIILRVQLNSGWGTASVYVDGVKPSTISGLAAYSDTINCNADSYPGTVGTVYHDIVIADGLSSGNHTVDIYANTTGTQTWVSLSAAKTRSYSQKPYVFKGWKSPVSTGLNSRTLSFKNLSSDTFKNVTLTVPANLVKQDGTSYTSPISIGDIAPGAQYDFAYSIDGSTQPDSTSYIATFSALYPDPLGSTNLSSTNTYDVNSSAIVFTGAWNKDQGAPNSTWRAFTTGTNQKASFVTDATSFVITLQKEFGWGSAKVMVGSTQYATLTSNDAVGGGFLQDVTVSGLPSGTKTIDIISTTAAAKPFVFTKLSYTKTSTYSQVNENVVLNYAYSYVPPFAPKNPRLQGGMVTWDASNRTDLDITIPRDNSNLTEYRVYSRFPTYCVYYFQGKQDILSQYDIVIIEPSAVSRQQVKAWQDKGIKVFGYVSFGEEDGERPDIFDLASSALGPHKDDQGGPGGYASYYNKGGNLFGEASECQLDNQRVLGTKTCAVGNPKYFTGTGRCSTSCTNDWRDGYITQQAGGTCKAGFTIHNNWIRDAMTACSNKSCPSYTPVNQKCTQYVPSDVKWGQDYSMATPNYPDQNGIWGSSFINPIAPRWKQKLQNFYMPTVFGTGQNFTETYTCASHTNSDGSTKLVFRLNNYPIDDNETFTVKSADGTIEYKKNLDYSYDATAGVIAIEPTAGVDAGYTAPVAGTQFSVTYQKKGLQCDGIFMDTVDTVDVYPSEQFNQAMADMINSLKASNPTKYFCSNRGFSVLDKIISSCSHVMFETFLSEYNWDTGQYYEITDPDSVSFNDGIKKQLRNLRRQHKFDVFALNYCDNGPSGDALRQKINDQCYAEGYMSWTSTIDLNDPLPVIPMNVNPGGAIRSNTWMMLRKSKVQ
ncbi:hypothetical protein RsoM2USA_411 [Ralstonia phage RsoM2USA]|nr:hypothetical protein RsoM2USA_411 [Ralstonia phage RsoM2USA]